MIGSAMRKPRIQPGRGSASADSMIEGRTMVIGTGVGRRRLPYWATSARSPSALVNG